MNIEQIKDLTAQAVCQLLGNDYYSTEENYVGTVDYIKALDSAKLIDVGKTVADFNNGTEQFTKSLIDQLSKIYIDSREYIGELPDIFIDNNVWGGFIESVQYDLAKIIDDEMYDLQDGQTYDDHKFYGSKVSVKIFGERKAITIPYSRATKQLRTAFKSWSDMSAYVAGLDVWVQNTVKVIYETYAKMLISTACALSIDNSNGALDNRVHLLTEYNTLHSTSLTPEQALETKDFTLYVAKRIKEIRRLTSRIGTQFNDGTVNTFTPETDKRLILLGNYVDALQFTGMSNTYHTDDILNGLGDYKEISTWQGVHSIGESKYAFTISTNLGSGDVITICGKDFTEGVNFDAGASASDTATALVTRLNASSNANITPYTWSNVGATITATTKSTNYDAPVITAVMGEGATGVITDVITTLDGSSVNTLKDLSTIKIKASSKLPWSSDFSKSYVIGLLYDYRGIGITVNEQFVTSSYTGIADFYSYYIHLLFNYIINSGYNMVAFVLD